MEFYQTCLHKRCRKGTSLNKMKKCETNGMFGSYLSALFYHQGRADHMLRLSFCCVIISEKSFHYEIYTRSLRGMR